MTVAPRGCGLGLASQTGNPQGGPRVAPRKDTCLPTSSAAASSRRRETKLFPPVVGRPVISSNQGGQLRSRPSRLAGHVTAGGSGPTGLGADRLAQLPLERARGARAGRTTVGGARDSTSATAQHPSQQGASYQREAAWQPNSARSPGLTGDTPAERPSGWGADGSSPPLVGRLPAPQNPSAQSLGRWSRGPRPAACLVIGFRALGAVSEAGPAPARWAGPMVHEGPLP